MIGGVVTGEDGIPLDNNRQQLSPSAYQPPKPLMDLFGRCQMDYDVAWRMQHRSFDEFDGYSLLDRANLDQQTFGAYVGVRYIPRTKQWRWRGRKNTARNKIIAILAQVLASVLIPTVFATDDEENDSKEAARAMKILLEEYLRRASYELKFMYMVLSALVNPAVFVHVEWIQAIQRVKVALANGKIEIKDALDDLLSGLNLSVVPIDELMLGDFFTFDLQRQPFLVRLRRISWDEARKIYAGQYFDAATAGQKHPKSGMELKQGDMIDRFDYVKAGQTRVFIATNENATLYDIDWTEADRDMVQVATFYYRGDDLEVTWVGGIFMGNFDPEKPDELYNANPMTHRRMVPVGDAWGSMPVYPYAKSGFEPLDPSMRFAYYKSAAFKEFWDDATLNVAHQLLVDGMKLDVIKPILISGVAKYDGNVMSPGAVSSLPKDATVAPYQLGPNLAAAMNVLEKEARDIEDSTVANILQGQLDGKQTATAALTAVSNAKRMLGVFGVFVADLVTQVGDLSNDEIIMNVTVGEMQERLPGALGMKYQTMLVRSKDGSRSVNHKLVFTDKYMGKKMTPAEKRAREWELWQEAGGTSKDALKIWEINPYQLARKRYRTFVDADEMVMRASGADRARKMTALNVLTDPRVAPYTDPEAVINDFAIEEYGGNDPEKYKRKGNSADALMGAIGAKPPVDPQMIAAQGGAPVVAPSPLMNNPVVQ